MPDELRVTARRTTRRKDGVAGSRSRPVQTARSVAIREAGPADVESIVGLRLALAREESPGSSTTRGSRAAGRLRSLTERQLCEPDGVIFLATAARRDVGILRCADPGVDEPGERTALVTTVFVASSHRRRGVLRALLRQAESWCRARGVTSLRLRVGAGNAVGQAAWLSLGFAPHAILMSRPLAGD